MPSTTRPPVQERTPLSMIDTRNDKRTRYITFFLRMVSIVFFVPLFAGIPLTFRYNRGFDPVQLWELGLTGIPGIVSYLLIGVGIYGIVALHEALHAAFLAGFGRTVATLSIVGFTPKASAPEIALSRLGAFIVTVGPFFVGSIIGVSALLVVPDRAVSWAFLPTVAHGVVSAADFVVVAWIFGVPKNASITMLVDGCVAYKEYENGIEEEL